VYKRQGIKFEIAPKIPLEDGIEATRQILGISWFDEERCKEGITHLENYKKEWDSRKGVWRTTPQKSPHNHGADAIRMGATCRKSGFTRHKIKIPTVEMTAEAWT